MSQKIYCEEARKRINPIGQRKAKISLLVAYWRILADGCSVKAKLVLFLITGFSVSARAMAAGYYVSSLTGKDSNPGTRADPWASLTKAGSVVFQPGDTLYFERGSAFNGGMEINVSGTAEKPVVITYYGNGPAPKFTNPDPKLLSGNVFRLSGSYLVIDGLYFYDCAAVADTAASYEAVWEVGAVRIILGADHCTVKNCEFSNCPKGIQSTGEYALITRNYLHSANSRPLSSPGWGPIGIHMGNGHQEVSYNVIKDYYYIGGEFGADGGAMEIDDGRNPKTDIYIHHNYTSSNMGFLEVSWFADITKTETHDLRVAYNVSDDYQQFVMLWAPTHETFIENNTILRRKQVKNAIVPTVFLCDYGGNFIRNNLVIVDSLTQVFTGKPEYLNTNRCANNLYWSVDGSKPKTGISLHSSELYNVDPLFVKAPVSESDFSLRRKSPAIDAGADLKGKYTIDFLGNSVPMGKGTDIGAFEFKKR